MRDLSFRQLPELAISEGATTPTPSGTNAWAWSTTLGRPVFWTGSKWTSGIMVPQAYSPTAASTLTLDVAVSDEHRVQMPNGNITLAISNEGSRHRFIVSVTQDGTGSRLVTWFGTIRWAGGVAPTLTTTANKRDTFIFIRTGTNTWDGFVSGQNI